MQKKDAKIWRFVTKKIKNGYGVTDLTHKVIAINKQYHKSKGDHAPGIKKNKDGSASLMDTIAHELEHKDHPKMHEKTVRKVTRKKVKRMSQKQKEKLYNKFNG